MRRHGWLLVAMLGLLAPWWPGRPASAANPGSATVSVAAPKATWEGRHFTAAAVNYARHTCVTKPALAMLCDRLVLTVDVPHGYWDGRAGGVEITIRWDDPDDVFTIGAYRQGEHVPLNKAGGSGSTSETIVLPEAAGTYDIYVIPVQVVDSGYSGTATLRTRAVPMPSPRGPCTQAAMLSMPAGAGHDHTDITQHTAACGIRKVFFDSLVDELGAQQDVQLGEMDVENGVAAVAVTHPESGVLFFDVSDPAHPRFLSWYRGSACEVAVQDVNCGAFIDLSADGTIAFLSVQSLNVVPDSTPDPAIRPVSEPGVEVIDLRDPTAPRLSHAYPVLSQGGVHTSRSHVIPAAPEGGGPRAPGEYLFSNANRIGVEVTRVERIAGAPALVPVTRILMDEVHDTFVQNDALSGRTYLYVAAGLESGFYVYDVTDPSAPVLKAEWDPTPDCPSDWYGHTVDVAVRNGRRFVTLDAETFILGSQTSAEQANGCGQVIGNGDKPGPLWIVDATDLGTLGPAVAQGADDDAALERSSAAALVATWTNPAQRPGEHLRFSPHNQQIVGDRIYLSHYHGGLYVLDASAAFRGRDERPTELGVYVPDGRETRPFYTPNPDPITPFVSDIFPVRSSLWDAVYYRGYVLAADEYGGLYSLQYRGDTPEPRARPMAPPRPSSRASAVTQARRVRTSPPPGWPGMTCPIALSA